MRSQIVMSQGIKIINDCYNANPASMKAALQLLAQTASSRLKIAVLGDMLELGSEAVRMHEEVGDFVAHHGVDRMVACGPLAASIADGARRAGMEGTRVLEVSDAAAAATTVKAMVKEGDVVLVKASRGVKLEQVVQALQGTKRAAKKSS
jgi:UDP-N-acetylmuramoyl-tripeptide--D-alanyl-D-alanine ligase